VIKGWDQGVVGMKVGGSRRLIIPPDLGYGSTAQNGIPANATLVFEISLLSVQ
jgi:peptidylprolyl isomerase